MNLGQLRVAAKLAVDCAARSNTQECVLWAYRVNIHGYGCIKQARKEWLVHRLVYFKRHGNVPDLLRHTCDVRNCINPNHLLPGTQLDNMRDMVERGRAVVGEACVHSKLIEADVRTIREVYVKGTRWKPGNCKELAAKYGVNINQIQRVARGASWSSTV